jgi:hypothetical protein
MIGNLILYVSSRETKGFTRTEQRMGSNRKIRVHEGVFLCCATIKKTYLGMKPLQ